MVLLLSPYPPCCFFERNIPSKLQKEQENVPADRESLQGRFPFACACCDFFEGCYCVTLSASLSLGTSPRGGGVERGRGFCYARLSAVVAGMCGVEAELPLFSASSLAR